MIKPYLEEIYSALKDEDGLTKVWQKILTRHAADSFYGAVWAGTSWDAWQMEAFGAIGIGSGGLARCSRSISSARSATSSNSSP